MTLETPHPATQTTASSPKAPVRPAPGNRVYNFTAGPATLPLEVMEQVREDLYDYGGLGAGIAEISHRSPEFHAIVEEGEALLHELMDIPDDYRVLFCHGGGQLQFSMVPLNLIGLKPARKALYVDTGSFAARAADIATRYGYVHVPAHSRETDYDRVPRLDAEILHQDASYIHITSNNTAMGTYWRDIPHTGALPLVADMTSEILSRVVDVRRFGLIYAGAQKNLGPSGLAMVILRKELLGHSLPGTPQLLNYTDLASDRHSMGNTPATLPIYMMLLILRWVKEKGGVAAMEKTNAEKAAILYRVIDGSGFYRGFALTEHRSPMNVTFDLPDGELCKRFVAEALAAGLYGLAGHVARGGLRASIYNAMPMGGASLLADFMIEFERANG
ncbi:MAG: 3-phosphoserine/phosphohydroxythreonine transaminase [bacterium]